jgi:hypothetical protein
MQSLIHSAAALAAMSKLGAYTMGKVGSLAALAAAKKGGASLAMLGMAGMKPEHAIATSYEELLEEYEKAGTRYGITPHRYWSTVGFPFIVEQSYVDANGFTRYLARCPAQTFGQYFGYAVGDEVGAFGLPPVTTNFRASYAETNLLTRRSTNDEDFAIHGISATARGVRVVYPNAGVTVAGTTDPEADAFYPVVQAGASILTDTSSTILPPEVSSPLMLQDVAVTALRGRMSYQIFWDNKASDYLALHCDVPEGGANTYLNSHGQPTMDNFFTLKDGWTWRKSDRPRDKLMTIYGRVEQDVWIAVVQPPLNEDLSPTTGDLGALDRFWLEIRLALHGVGFYYPSENV